MNRLTRFVPLAVLSSIALSLPVFSAGLPPASTPAWFSENKTAISLPERSYRKWDNALVADLDQDGHMDLVLTEHTRRALVYWNNGGIFSEPVELITGDTHGVAAGDYDRDGKMDLIIYHGGGGGKKPRNPVAFHISRDRQITGGEEFEHFERSRGRAAKYIDNNGDGALDLVLSAFPLSTQKEDGCNQVFRNAANGEFEFVTKLPQPKWMGFRALVTDVDNDGLSDIILYGGANVVVARGKDDLSFSNAGAQVLGELENTDYISSMAEIDYDNDGDFDLMVTRSDHPFTEKTYCDCENDRFAYYVFAAFREDSTYRYDLEIDGDFHMENLQMAYPDLRVFAGAQKRELEFADDPGGQRDVILKPGEAAGWPADISENGLNIGHLGGCRWRVGGETKSTTSGFIHNVKKGPAATPPKELPAMLWENRDGVFVNVTDQSGISIPEQTTSAAAGDFDNDGWTDLFVLRHGDMARTSQQLVYRNLGGKSFVRIDNHGIVSDEFGSTGCAAELLDYDEDGDLDIIYCNERGRWHLCTNTGNQTDGNNWLTVQVGASPSGKATAQGAVLTLKAGGKTYRRIVGSTSAAYSHGMNTHLHIGLGSCEQIDEAVVRWTTGETQTIRIDAVNQGVSAGQMK
jgi:hypothetical protein